MHQCVHCHRNVILAEEPPRYDVFHPEYDPATAKPYCEECFADTLSGAISSGVQPD